MIAIVGRPAPGQPEYCDLADKLCDEYVSLSLQKCRKTAFVGAAPD
jgi:hypothetical protein